MKPLSIVIAEDDPQIAEITRRFIERVDGYELVGLANDLDQARDLVEVYQPDLLILDVQFPKGTGIEFLHQLRSEKNMTEVIMVTGAREMDTIKEALMKGVFDYIVKPLAFERLERSLKSFRAHVQKLNEVAPVDQAAIDALLPRNAHASSPVEQKLPKGIDELTLAQVKDVFDKPDAVLSAEEVGRKLGASRITARRYLEYLISIDYLTAQIQYGSVGRPERRYGLRKCG